MSLSYSNIFKAPEKSVSPLSLGSALQNKATPSPLSFSPQAFSLTQPKSSGVTPTAAPPQVKQPTAPAPIQAQPGLTANQVQQNLANFNAANPATSAPAAKPVTGNTQQSPNMVGGFVQPEAPRQNQLQVQAQQDAQQNTTQAGLLGQGVAKLQEAGEVQKQAGLLQQAMARQKQDVMGNPYYSGSVKIGQSGIIDQNQGSQLQGLNAQQQALTSQGTAFTSAASQAAPQQVGYGVQYINPLTGQSALPNGGASGSQNPQTQASTYAQEVASGKRSYDDAVSGMGLYGTVGKQFLDQAIRNVNPNFNFAQAQTLGASQGAVGPAVEYANTALAAVENAMKNVGVFQNSNIPAVNKVGDLGSFMSGIGSQETRELVGTVQTLRNAYASVLASTRGGTPTDYSSQAIAEIPDRPTPHDIAAVKANLAVLGAARQNIYGNPGGGTTGSSGGSSVQAGGYNFVQDAQGNWVPAN